MKNSTNDGFDQHYNVQVGVDQEHMLIVANGVSDHPNDKGEAIPTVEPFRRRWVNRKQRLWTTGTSVRGT